MEGTQRVRSEDGVESVEGSSLAPVSVRLGVSWDPFWVSRSTPKGCHVFCPVVRCWASIGLLLSFIAAEYGLLLLSYGVIFFELVSSSLSEPLRADVKLPS